MRPAAAAPPARRLDRDPGTRAGELRRESPACRAPAARRRRRSPRAASSALLVQRNRHRCPAPAPRRPARAATSSTKLVGGERAPAPARAHARAARRSPRTPGAPWSRRPASAAPTPRTGGGSPAAPCSAGGSRRRRAAYRRPPCARLLRPLHDLPQPRHPLADGAEGDELGIRPRPRAAVRASSSRSPEGRGGSGWGRGGERSTRRSAPFSPTSPCCPTISSSVRGRIRSASGASSDTAPPRSGPAGRVGGAPGGGSPPAAKGAFGKSERVSSLTCDSAVEPTKNQAGHVVEGHAKEHR